jgi:hypothetical protein
MVAALLGRVREDGMTFFNHKIEYLPTWPCKGLDKVEDGREIRSATVSYDNLFGVRCEYRFHAPADMWTKLVVGGMMSTGGLKSLGVISKTTGGYTVRSANLGESRHDFIFHTEQPKVGQQVVIFDAVEHGEQMFGQFYTAITNKLEIAELLDIHSINIMIYNEDTRIGTVHIDPFTSVANYDEFKIVVGKDQWDQIEIERALA